MPIAHQLRSLPFFVCCTLMVFATAPARSSEPPAVEPPRTLADDPAVMGVWHGVMPWPDKAVHSILLHTGKVLWYRGEGGTVSTSYTWDPATNTLESQVLGYGVFCSGHSVLPDGRVLDTGGRIGTSGSLGPKYTVIFDPITQQWSRGPDMHNGRYYPTQLSLGDGRTLVFSGYDNTHTINEQVESFRAGSGPGGTDQWDVIPNADHFMAYYPRFHLLPSGLAIHVGKDPAAETFDPATGAWKPIASSNYGSRAEGTSFILPPGFDKIMIVGGGSSTNTAEILDTSAPNPTWTYTAPMKYGRMHLNSVLLPDGTVLVAGGASGSSPVYPGEIYDPDTGTWREVAAMHTFRMYHSSALLLPDGRCLWAGTDDNHSAEVYSPPYLFRGTRPVIDSAPASVQYGESFKVGTADPSSIGSVVLMRPGATTHSQNMEQRYVPLTYSIDTEGRLDVQTPTNPNTAPPGYYMLFILDRNKVPSVARWVLLGGTAGPIANRPPTVFAGPDLVVTLPASAILEGSVTDDGQPAPPARTEHAWRKESGPGDVTFGDSLALRTTAAFSLAGDYELSLDAFDGDLRSRGLVTLKVYPPGTCDNVLDRRLAAGADDAEEKAGGSVSLASSDLEFVYDGAIQIVGLRFTQIGIPPRAVITKAYLQFTADEAQSEATTLQIGGQAADSALVFTTASRNVSSRPRTNALVEWKPQPWDTVGAAGLRQRTPDIASIVQEIVDRPGWTGRSLAFIVTGTGHRTAEAFEGVPTGTTLHVEYACSGGNRRPIVDAGRDQTITWPETAILDPDVTDDGMPLDPGEVAVTWSKVSGRGEVTFEDFTAPVRGPVLSHDSNEKLATFSEPDTYVLRVTASDGELAASDEVKIVVLPEGGLPQVVERSVIAGADDAEEKASGSVSLTSSDLELVFDGSVQTIGIRFTAMAIPPGARITNAWIQFTSDETQSDSTSLRIDGQDVDNATTFTTATRGISSRPRTGVFVEWKPAPWTAVGVAGAAQRTPDLTPVIAAIVGRGGWASGNAVAIVITGTGHRTARAFEGRPAATLHVEFLAPPPAPLIQAGPGGVPGGRGIETRLVALFPNPMARSATVRFDVARASEVQLEIYDVRGALMRRVASGWREAGSYSETWDGRDRGGRRMPKGVYLVRFTAGSHRETRKLVVDFVR